MSVAIPNFYQVDDRVYRGGRPSTDDDYKWLRDHCGAIVNLEGDSVAAVEYARVKDSHEFLWAPISPFEIYADAPPLVMVDYTVDWLNSLRDDTDLLPTYVHCQHGQDRTGLIIAAYRMSQGWSWEDAHAEAVKLGYREHINLGLNRVFEELKGRYGK